jgi:hypothetical protein
MYFKILCKLIEVEKLKKMVNFREKIEFLLKNLYNNDINGFVKNFIKYSSPTSEELRKRKVAIKK